MSEEVRVITKAQYEEYMELKKQARATTKRWKPKNDEKYVYITPDFKLNAEYFEGQFDEECWSAGNCFKTEEEAQKELDRRLAEQELLELCDWEEGGSCYEIEYNFNEKCFKADSYITYYCFSPYRFASQYSAQKALNELGTDKLKLIFRID